MSFDRLLSMNQFELYEAINRYLLLRSVLKQYSVGLKKYGD